MDDEPRELQVTVRITDGGLVLPAELVRAAGLERGARVMAVNDGKLLVSPWPHGYDGEEPQDAEPPYYSEEEMRRMNDDLERDGPDRIVWPGEEGYEEALASMEAEDARREAVSSQAPKSTDESSAALPRRAAG